MKWSEIKNELDRKILKSFGDDASKELYKMFRLEGKDPYEALHELEEKDRKFMGDLISDQEWQELVEKRRQKFDLVPIMLKFKNKPNGGEPDQP